MKRRAITAILAVCLAVTLFSCLPAAVRGVEVSDDEIITELMKWFNIKEGNANSVNANDNGAVSIGMIQWHGPRALALLKQIVEAVGETRSRALLGNALYDEILLKKPADWNNRVMTADEKAKLVAFLSTDESREIQLAMARNDISGYVSHARRLNLTTPALIFYACDIENQYGSYGLENYVLKPGRITAGLSDDETFHYLYDFHQALLNATDYAGVQNYISRRKATYSYVVNTLKWESLPCPVRFDAAGGTGTLPGQTRIFAGETLKLAKSGLTKTGYAFAGWNLTRASDGAWYAADGAWYSAAQFTSGAKAKYLFTDGQAVAFSEKLLSGPAGDTFTFAANWVLNGFTVELYGNYSGGSYLLCSDLSTLPGAAVLSAAGNYTLALEQTDTLDRINSLRVTAAAAGSPASALTMATSLNGSEDEGYQSEAQTLTLTFYAKADRALQLSAAFRSGTAAPENPATVTLSKEWKKYTLTVAKAKTCGSDLLLWTGGAGELCLSQMQLTVGTPGEFLPENGGKLQTFSVEYGKTYSGLPTPKRTGYVFKGWYTAAAGGTRITGDTRVTVGNRRLYAQWTKNWSCVLYGHEWKYQSSAEPACAAWGTDTYVCVDCGAKDVRQVLQPLGHEYGPWTVEQAATCEEDGLRSRSCTRCGARDSERIRAAGHVPGELITDTPATCVVDGSGHVSCKLCGQTIYETVLPASGHTPGTAVTVTAPTCTEPGRTETRCTACGELLAARQVEPAGHQWTEDVWTVPGDNDGVTLLICQVCGTRENLLVPGKNHQHNYVKTVVAPTCGAEGYDLYRCRCGDSYRENAVSALPHETTAVTVAVSCTQPGVTLLTCERCGETWEAERTEALGHAMAQLQVLRAPTMTASGLALYGCSRCGWKELRTLPVLSGCDGGENCPGAKFKDMPPVTNWAHAGIDFCVTEGLFSGTSETTFEPTGMMTRAMLVSVLYRLAAAPEPTGRNPFADVGTAWYTKAVIWAAENGIVSGVAEDRFDPMGNVTREQIVAILYRYTIYKDYDFTAQKELSGFPDAAAVSTYARKPMAWATASGIVSGQGSGGIVLLNPRGTATRQEVASILARFVQKVKQ